jgi:alanyl-tRNA synthetase
VAGKGQFGRSRPRIAAGERHADPFEARSGEVARSDDEEIRGTFLGRGQKGRGVVRRHGADAGRAIGQGHGDMGATGEEDRPSAVARQMEAEGGDDVGEPCGRELLGTGKDAPYSVELCGGTHVARTGDIALFKITGETGIAAGIRRVEALTGEAARQFLLAQAGVAKTLAQTFKIQPLDVTARVEALSTERKALEKQVAELKKQLALGGGGSAPAAPEEINGIKLIARILDGVDGKGLRGVAEDFRKQVGSGVVALIGVTDGKAAVTVAATSDVTDRVNAADLARAAVIAMGGQGAGGKADFAQGGAPDGSKAEAGLAAMRAALA